MNDSTYEELYADLQSTYGEISLPPEYAYFFQKDLIRPLIRLARYKFIAKQLGPDDEVLEIGCGSGVGAIMLSQACKSVKGIDTNDKELSAAKKISQRPNLEFERIDFFQLPAHYRYDAIVCLDVIEHLNEDDGRRLLKETTRHVKPHGVLMLGSPSLYSLPHQGELSRASHIKCYDLAELRRLVGDYYHRSLCFSMNDEMVHTGHAKMAWYYFIIALNPKV